MREVAVIGVGMHPSEGFQTSPYRILPVSCDSSNERRQYRLV